MATWSRYGCAGTAKPCSGAPTLSLVLVDAIIIDLDPERLGSAAYATAVDARLPWSGRAMVMVDGSVSPTIVGRRLHDRTRAIAMVDDLVYATAVDDRLLDRTRATAVVDEFARIALGSAEPLPHSAARPGLARATGIKYACATAVDDRLPEGKHTGSLDLHRPRLVERLLE